MPTPTPAIACAPPTPAPPLPGEEKHKLKRKYNFPMELSNVYQNVQWRRVLCTFEDCQYPECAGCVSSPVIKLQRQQQKQRRLGRRRWQMPRSSTTMSPASLHTALRPVTYILFEVVPDPRLDPQIVSICLMWLQCSLEEKCGRKRGPKISCEILVVFSGQKPAENPMPMDLYPKKLFSRGLKGD